MVYLLLVILGIAAVGAELSLLSAWISAYFRFHKELNVTYSPSVCVFVPCKYVGKNFRENITALINQNYREYSVIFITDSDKDPAYLELQTICKQRENISIITADFLEGSSGKISALLGGIHHAGDVEVYVFADADITPKNQWLSSLISPLKKEGVGATTGYRWYYPTSIQSLFVSVWNMANSISLYYKSYNFAWGGSTAITKDLFERLDVAPAWRTGFSDDLILTKILKKAGYTIQFVPTCVSESPVDEKTWKFIKWGTRQLTWVKWYYPSAWILGVIGAIGLKVATVSGVVLLGLGYILPGVLMVSTIGIECITGFVGHRILRSHMYVDNKRFGSSLSYALMMPIVFFILAYNNLASVFTREIRWGGRRYHKPKINI